MNEILIIRKRFQDTMDFIATNISYKTSKQLRTKSWIKVAWMVGIKTSKARSII